MPGWSILPLFPRRFQLPIPLSLNLLLMPGEHVLWRDVADRAVQTNVVVMLYVTLTSRVYIDVDDHDLLTRVLVGNLIAVVGRNDQEFLIGITDSVTRQLREEALLDAEDEQGRVPMGQLVRIAQICQSEDRPDESWFQITKLRDVSQSLPSVRKNFEKRNRERRTVLTEYEPGILGVECDGASYHSSATARDRDRIRQQILEKLGWKIHRVWSPDWVTRRETDVHRLKAAIQAGQNARGKRISADPSQSSDGPTAIDPPAIVEKALPQVNDKWASPEWVVKYRVCRPRVPMTRGLQFHDPDALPVLKRMLSQIVDLEGPVHKDVAATRLAKAWELDRVGERMMHAIKSTWRSLSRDGLLKIQGSFLWPSVPTFQLAVRQPSPSENESRRSIEEISSEETALAMKNLVRDSLSIERDSLLLYVARIFGFERAGNQIQKALEDTLNELVETRQLVLLDGRVSLPN